MPAGPDAENDEIGAEDVGLGEDLPGGVAEAHRELDRHATERDGHHLHEVARLGLEPAAPRMTMRNGEMALMAIRTAASVPDENAGKSRYGGPRA